MPPSGFNRNLAAILNDNLSGSTDILIRIAELVNKYSEDKIKIRKILDAAKNSFNHFPVVIQYLVLLAATMKKYSPDKVKTVTKDYLDSLSEKHYRIYKKHSSLLNKLNCILTISNSRTTAGLFKLMHHHNKKLEVIVCESRPVFEGRNLVRELLADKIRCRLITDAAMAFFIEKCDAVIVGADQILSNRDVVNKTGSRIAAICCKYFDKPFYVAASKDKKVKRQNFIPAEAESSEVFELQDRNLRIHNFYFEIIEKKLITKILTD